MTISYKTFIVTTIISVGIAGLAGYFYAKRTTPAEITIQEVEVIREVEKIQKDVRIVERVIERPDGTKETEKIIEDRSLETNIKQSNKEAITQTDFKKQWRLGYMHSIHGDAAGVQGLLVERRLFNNVSGGIFAQNNGTVGLTISIEF